jgi:two-component system, cell cycle sensor histidine kinase and response regulator CckA
MMSTVDGQAVGVGRLQRLILALVVPECASACPDDESRRRLIIANVCALVGVLNLLPLGMTAYLGGHSTLAWLDFILAVILIATTVYLRRTGRFVATTWTSVITAGGLFLYLFASGGIGGTGHLWMYTFPVFTSFLLGSRQGTVASLILLVTALPVLLLEQPLSFLDAHVYGRDFTIRFIPSYLVVLAFSVATESLREKTHRRISARNRDLADVVIMLGEKEQALATAHERLEERVRERTADLDRANIDLRNEIRSRHDAEDETAKLQQELLQAQKMEALGTLAGGVAHDLNNILSGIVGYPELMLEDLPEDSPLRGPLVRVLDSGRQCARIVQDLLTMARRGVAVSQPLHLNEIVETYVSSPEYESLLARHSDVEVSLSLGPETPCALGSPHHLGITLMNLVTNAMEAMPHGGRARIETCRADLIHPLRGSETVPPGAYAVMRIEDSGVGISSELLHRMFEPFFSTKEMGRSGTGLGMAVVWATVQDHRGFIDVQSEEGQGTTMSLYFPEAYEAPEDDPRPESDVDFRGRGETVLVVDDVEQQRDLALLVLTRLGYLVRTAASGEEAVETLASAPADLLLLDMIMESGIDGLETYERALEIRPEQRAVIVTGFSESERVREALRLGAGACVRKPYLMEELGRVVRAELDCADGRTEPALDA